VLQSEAIDLCELIGSLEDMLRRTLGETVALRIDCSANIWPAMVDAHQFESALLNMAINARDAMPRGGVLEIGCANTTLDLARTIGLTRLRRATMSR
jgi:signal transduction histidine kinase